jgi:hypothetical protein
MRAERACNTKQSALTKREFCRPSDPLGSAFFSRLLKRKTPSTTRDDNLRRRGDQAINSSGNGSDGAKKQRWECTFDNIDAHDISTYPTLKNPSKERLKATTPSIVAGQERRQRDARQSTPEDRQATIDKQQSTIDNRILTTNKRRSTFSDKPSRHQVKATRRNDPIDCSATDTLTTRRPKTDDQRPTDDRRPTTQSTKMAILSNS